MEMEMEMGLGSNPCSVRHWQPDTRRDTNKGGRHGAKGRECSVLRWCLLQYNSQTSRVLLVLTHEDMHDGVLKRPWPIVVKSVGRPIWVAVGLLCAESCLSRMQGAGMTTRNSSRSTQFQGGDDTMEDGINLLLQAAISKIPAKRSNSQSSSSTAAAAAAAHGHAHGHHHDDDHDAEGEVEHDEEALSSATAHPAYTAASQYTTIKQEDRIVYPPSAMDHHHLDEWLPPANAADSHTNNGRSSSPADMVDPKDYVNMDSPVSEPSVSSPQSSPVINAPIALAAELTDTLLGRSRVPDFDDLPIQMDALGQEICPFPNCVMRFSRHAKLKSHYYNHTLSPEGSVHSSPARMIKPKDEFEVSDVKIKPDPSDSDTVTSQETEGKIPAITTSSTSSSSTQQSSRRGKVGGRAGNRQSSYGGPAVATSNDVTASIKPDSVTGLYQCPFPGCARGFGRRFNLRTHHAATHRRERPWACGKCDRRFSRRSDMERHGRLLHGDSKGGRYIGLEDSIPRKMNLPSYGGLVGFSGSADIPASASGSYGSNGILMNRQTVVATPPSIPPVTHHPGMMLATVPHPHAHAHAQHHHYRQNNHAATDHGSKDEGDSEMTSQIRYALDQPFDAMRLAAAAQQLSDAREVNEDWHRRYNQAKHYHLVQAAQQLQMQQFQQLQQLQHAQFLGHSLGTSGPPEFMVAELSRLPGHPLRPSQYPRVESGRDVMESSGA
ncbi:hypothetical protein SeMB42_g06296 [Synchytrium endobioticum]|uniref:C2H2-type domain-containing protein n=1 Tax=Synchytrium endobioticum TaxID=286115 RepID=A0A507CJ31_9FUNG|nr:hypothetical protein SeMB42_g06296 [Synchytrium endobioticum]